MGVGVHSFPGLVQVLKLRLPCVTSKITTRTSVFILQASLMHLKLGAWGGFPLHALGPAEATLVHTAEGLS